MDTKIKSEAGLSSYDKLDKDSGIIFPYNKWDEIPYFWMKGVRFPIDILWIKNRQIVQIISNIPPAKYRQADSSLRLYYYPRPVDFVLEINGGEANRNGIKKGDLVDY